MSSRGPRVARPLTGGNAPSPGRRPTWSFPTAQRPSTTAIRLAGPGDVVVLAGKGHEDYQIIGETKYPFDDREEARKAIGK